MNHLKQQIKLQIKHNAAARCTKSDTSLIILLMTFLLTPFFNTELWKVCLPAVVWRGRHSAKHGEKLKTSSRCWIYRRKLKGLIIYLSPHSAAVQISLGLVCSIQPADKDLTATITKYVQICQRGYCFVLARSIYYSLDNSWNHWNKKRKIALSQCSAYRQTNKLLWKHYLPGGGN